MKLRKTVIVGLLCMISIIAHAVTRTVSLDGTQQFTSIQEAVSASSSYDTVLVYPGRYVENVTINCHYITLASLYSTNPDQQIIENTVIDGNLGTCIKIYRSSYVTISGFTLVNNEDNLLNSPNNPGGGIFAEYAYYTTIENTIIRNCIAQSGGGILGVRSSLSLSNVNIFNNQALRYGGGLSVERTGLSLSSTNPCSIYNNHATFGMDISIVYPFTEHTLPIEIILAGGSTAISEVDGYFIMVHNASDVSVNIAQGAINQIDHDLYVAPDGDDNNSGTSPASPLKTIAVAMQRIASNPDNPKTIHLAPGLYSHSANGQILPMGENQTSKCRAQGWERPL